MTGKSDAAGIGTASVIHQTAVQAVTKNDSRRVSQLSFRYQAENHKKLIGPNNNPVSLVVVYTLIYPIPLESGFPFITFRFDRENSSKKFKIKF